jgi:hypothetical protein
MQIVEFLVKTGQDPNVANKVGTHSAAAKKCGIGLSMCPPCVNFLFVQKTGETPLHCASKASKRGAASALLALGADAHAKNTVREVEPPTPRLSLCTHPLPLFHSMYRLPGRERATARLHVRIVSQCGDTRDAASARVVWRNMGLQM